jgi:hypothetical protein
MACIQIKLKPFSVPNFVLQEVSAGVRQDGFTESPKYSIKDLPDDVLNKLCDEFRDNVFKKKYGE